MASGFVSNYNDSGYSLYGTGIWFDANNNSVTSISTRDIYTTTQQCGVYLFDGKPGSSGTKPIRPIFSSTPDLRTSCIDIDVDDAWLVYPGYGFKLYTGTNWSGSSSVTYMNISNKPKFYYCSNGGYKPANVAVPGTKIIQSNGTDYPFDSSGGTTASVRIYFRGLEIAVNGIGSAT